MKRNFLAFALALLAAVPVELCFMGVPVLAETVQSGQYGKNVFWKYADGTLTIYGNGAMRDTYKSTIS